MRKITSEIDAIFGRLATIAIAVVVGLVFVLAGGAIAAPADKGDENNKAEVKEKIKVLEEKLDSKAFFNRNQIFDNNRVFGRNLDFDLGGNRLLFNRFNLFDIDQDLFGNDRD